MGTLETANASHLRAIYDLWTCPDNADFLNQCDKDELSQDIEHGNVLVWVSDETVSGFILLEHWAKGNIGFSDLAVTWRGRGSGHAMISTAIEELFSNPDMHRISLDTTIDNLRALGLFDRLGFVREGAFRECFQRSNGEWVDCVLFGMLRRDWHAVRNTD